MKLGDVLSIIEGKVISEQEVDLDVEIQMGCGADLMSDVLSFTHEGTLLMSGLTNPQVVRTAEVAGISDEVAALGPIGAAIPLAAGVESLNAAVAGAVLLFEAARQRRSRGVEG